MRSGETPSSSSDDSICMVSGQEGRRGKGEGEERGSEEGERGGARKAS